MAHPLQPSYRVFTRVLPFVVCAVVVGCGHHQVGRPPTVAEIAAINDTPDTGGAGIRLHYLEPDPCRAGGCTIEGLRAVSDTPPSEVRRIVAADQRQLTVVAPSGDVWHLDMSKVAGASRPARLSVRGTITGTLVGLVIGGFAVLIVDAFSGPGPDAQVDAAPAHPLSAGAAIGTALCFMIAGAIFGAIVDHQTPTIDSFDFGGGHGLESSGLHR